MELPAGRGVGRSWKRGGVWQFFALSRACRTIWRRLIHDRVFLRFFVAGHPAVLGGMGDRPPDGHVGRAFLRLGVHADIPLASLEIYRRAGGHDAAVHQHVLYVFGGVDSGLLL